MSKKIEEKLKWYRRNMHWLQEHANDLSVNPYEWESRYTTFLRLKDELDEYCEILDERIGEAIRYISFSLDIPAASVLDIMEILDPGNSNTQIPENPYTSISPGFVPARIEKFSGFIVADSNNLNQARIISIDIDPNAVISDGSQAVYFDWELSSNKDDSCINSPNPSI